MQSRLSAVTLAVQDLARSRSFYESLGWRPGFVADDVVFYQANGLVLALWQADSFKAETQLGAAASGVCLAHNVASRETVDKLLSDAAAAGGRIVHAGTARDWGGYSGHVADPDGHLWEVAWNPHWVLHQDGRTTLA